MGEMDYRRREASEVNVGGVPLGGSNPVRLQSMTSTSTMDTAGSVDQICRIAAAGGEYVRLTAQGVREAENLAEIRRLTRQRGVSVPLVADIHFNPRAAFAAAETVEKVRINPGNFVDPGRTFRHLEYTDEEYSRELQKISDTFVPFLELCRRNNTAIRIGVNHGSLSDRIMSRYGDTPDGMVESAMEFLRIAVEHDFHDIVISIKASNTVIMVETVRRLVAAMDAEGMKFPLHLGVTEAGDGEDGRVKSAVGIGTLLADGIGDTVRVSLSEEPEAEIPVAAELVNYITSRACAGAPIPGGYSRGYDRVAPSRRVSSAVGITGGDNEPVVPGYDAVDPTSLMPVDASSAHDEIIALANANPDRILLITSRHPNPVGEISAAIHALTDAGVTNPVIASLSYYGVTPEQVTVRAAADMGAFLLNGLVDGIDIQTDALDRDAVNRLSLGILQAARRRFTHTEFISCPGCGRTMFDLQSTVKTVKEATAHLKGLKIGIMGCIVNGPGEMADADYGYVGAAAGKVSLYRGKECIEKNIPSEDALPRLIELLKADGVWTDPR